MKKIFALILSILMLSSIIIVTTSAEEEVDWEALTYVYGLNVYVGAPIETPPVMDGVISEGEYSCQRVTPRESMIEFEAMEIQSDLTEYFAYNDEYVYIGATFEQERDNRAYWLQFRPLNSFDVYLTLEGAVNKYPSSTDSRIDYSYYSARDGVQFRYQSDGSVTGVADGSTVSSWPNVRLPLVGQTEDYEIMYAATKITDEQAGIYTKTYEVRISKAYIAERAACEIDEVRVIPYWTFFHAALWHAAPMTEELGAAILEVNPDAYIPGDDKGTYWFLVLDENPYPYPPIVTTELPTTTMAPTEVPTTEATTEVPTTEAATREPVANDCQSSITAGAVAMIPAIVGGAIILRRRKEDA